MKKWRAVQGGALNSYLWGLPSSQQPLRRLAKQRRKLGGDALRPAHNSDADIRSSPVPSPSKPAHRLEQVLTARSSRGWAWRSVSRHRSSASTSSHCPVEEGHLPAAMSAGEAGGPGLFPDSPPPGPGEAGGGEAVGQACAEEAGDVLPLERGTSQRTKA